MPKVTVLTPVHNGAKYLRETIESIQRQTFEDWEYILVDDGSTDGTPQLIEEMAAQDKRLRLIRREKAGGPFVAANMGLRKASGEYILGTDADDLSFPDRFQKQLDYMAAHPKVRACTTFALPLYETGPSSEGYTPPPLNPGSLKWFLILRCALCHSAYCIERAAYEEIGYYREEFLSQDYRLWCDLARRGWLTTIPETLVYWRIHPTSITRSNETRLMEFNVPLLRDHLAEIAREPWSDEEIATLHRVGGAEKMPMAKGLAVLARWDREWLRDDSLTPEERAELAERSAFRRRLFIRSNRRQLLQFARYAGQYFSPIPRGYRA